MNLLVNGVPLVSRMQTRLPDQATDWTGESLVFGSAEAMSIASLRIWPVTRDEHLQAVVLSPPADEGMRYCQQPAAGP